MDQTVTLTGKPSVDRPWMKYYPMQYFGKVAIPECGLREYLNYFVRGMEVPAIEFYGKTMNWGEFFDLSAKIERSLKAVGFGEGSQIPVFFHNVPEFLPLLFAAETIGASLLCRDNTLEENVEAVNKSGEKVVFAHDYLGQKGADAFLAGSAEKIVILPALNSANKDEVPDYVMANLNKKYTDKIPEGEGILSWDEFLALGDSYEGEVKAPRDINRPLYRCYTSGSTGPSKQVIHSAHNMVGILAQMNFYSGSENGKRPFWLVTALPPALIAVVITMDLLPLVGDNLLVISPFVDPSDVDLEYARYMPNTWPMVPMFVEVLINSKRLPADFDLNDFNSAGIGAEAVNNNQLKRINAFLYGHGFRKTKRFTVGYGQSEAGSTITLPMQPQPFGNGCVGVPLIFNTVSIFKPDTEEELTYNQEGEICITCPTLMLGYDDPESTAKALRVHADGKKWLHTGDIGYMTEDGVLYVTSRGYCPRFGGGEVNYNPMENKLADAEIPGIKDEFFVVVKDEEHPGCFVPYLYVVLNDGYTVDDIRDAVNAVMDPWERPVEIRTVEARPFFHFKTNRRGMAREIFEEKAAKKA